jgi:arsenate reductase (glutaredoxin)
MLKHYSFLKRPILIIEKRLFIGNSKETVLKAKIELDKL